MCHRVQRGNSGEGKGMWLGGLQRWLELEEGLLVLSGHVEGNDTSRNVAVGAHNQKSGFCVHQEKALAC